MKQTIIWLLSLIMTVGLIGCKEDEPITEPPVQSETEKDEQALPFHLERKAKF